MNDERRIEAYMLSQSSKCYAKIHQLLLELNKMIESYHGHAQ